MSYDASRSLRCFAWLLAGVLAVMAGCSSPPDKGDAASDSGSPAATGKPLVSSENTAAPTNPSSLNFETATKPPAPDFNGPSAPALPTFSGVAGGNDNVPPGTLPEFVIPEAPKPESSSSAPAGSAAAPKSE